MPDEYISREAALKYIKSEQCKTCSDIGLCGNCAVLVAVKLLEKVPAADVAPVAHGQWASEAKGGVYGPVCSVCGYYIPGISFWNAPYCPKCGARMDGAAE